MKRTVCLILLAAMLIMASAIPSQAGGHFYFRGGIWVGPGWWGPPYPYYYPYYPYYSEPPTVIERQAPAYVQPNRQQDDQDYWYFCAKPKGYYPYIKECPGGWLKVIPSAPSGSDIRNGNKSFEPENAPSTYEQNEKDEPASSTDGKRY